MSRYIKPVLLVVGFTLALLYVYPFLRTWTVSPPGHKVWGQEQLTLLGKRNKELDCRGIEYTVGNSVNVYGKSGVQVYGFNKHGLVRWAWVSEQPLNKEEFYTLFTDLQDKYSQYETESDMSMNMTINNFNINDCISYLTCGKKFVIENDDVNIHIAVLLTREGYNTTLVYDNKKLQASDEGL